VNPRPHPGRPANDNRAAFDVTEVTLMAFGPAIIVAIVVSALLLVKVW
jgi:hypothetical protein